MAEPTVDELREQARRAKAAFLALGGTLPEPRAANSPLSCADLHGAEAAAWWYAAGAILNGLPPEYYAYYSGLGEAYGVAADACDAAAAAAAATP